MPFGTLTLRNVRSGSPVASTRAARSRAIAAEGPKSNVQSRVRISDTAIAGAPSSAASSAPETVPE